jgi:predicted dehydrogenase
VWEYLFHACVRTKAMQKQLRFVVVGAGSIGREFALRHLVAANGAAVCAIVDPNRAAREALAADVAAAQRGARVEGTE